METYAGKIFGHTRVERGYDEDDTVRLQHVTYTWSVHAEDPSLNEDPRKAKKRERQLRMWQSLACARETKLYATFRARSPFRNHNDHRRFARPLLESHLRHDAFCPTLSCHACHGSNANFAHRRAESIRQRPPSHVNAAD